MNAVNRRNGASPGFVLVWIAGDIVNTYGLARAGAPETQVALAVWYGLADVALFIQLLWFGHRACSLRQPKSTYALISKLERRKKPWWYKLTHRFRNFGYFDDFVLLALFVLVATTAWGATLLSKMAANPDEEPFSAVHEWDLTSFLLGLTSALLFSGARIPEFIVGFIRDHRQLEPEQGQSDDDPIFAFLILENLTNIIAIVTRSFDDTYLLMETPWLVGSGLSIVIDAALMYCIRRWRRNYYRDSNPKWLAKKAEREEHAKLAQGLDAEIEEREEEGLLIDILTDVNMYRRDGAPAAAKLGFWARLFGDPDLEAYKERKVVAENFNTRRHDDHIVDLLQRIETRHPPSGEDTVELVPQPKHSVAKVQEDAVDSAFQQRPARGKELR
ncbi:uncharacterized protein JCM10292_004487 [Rhodotorula paludigena]|uniref:uncharacterized protein n=1 Tax=Rhodotorula paludigena TaxID=86838 RepID=UPI00316E91A7